MPDFARVVPVTAPTLGRVPFDQHGPLVRRLAGRGKCSRGAGHTHTREERVKAATPGGRDLRTTLEYANLSRVKYLRGGVSRYLLPCPHRLSVLPARLAHMG